MLKKFEKEAYEYNGIECWSATELQLVFNYTEWRNFLKAIDNAKTTCEIAAEKVSYHFVGYNKMVEFVSNISKP